VQFSDIAGFVAEGARLRSGDTLAADLVVLASGYKGQEYLVRKLFGDDVAARVGPIWGSAMSRSCATCSCAPPSRACGFIAGSFTQCRIYSKYLALQIKAREEGLLPASSQKRNPIDTMIRSTMRSECCRSDSDRMIDMPSR